MSMKIFPPEDTEDLRFQDHRYFKLAAEMSQLIVKICERLGHTLLRIEVAHTALYLFHAQARIVSFHRFDRFVYACATIFVAGKINEQLEPPEDIVRHCRDILKERKEMEK